VKTRIAVIADLHFGASSPVPERRSEIADTLFLRAAHRLNRVIKPDVTVVLGDIVDAGAESGAERFYEPLRKTVDLIDSPTIVIPGNHDCDAKTFYTYFEKPPEIVDVCGTRFVPLLDPEEPNYNARRTQEGFRSMAKARSGYSGPIVALQHVPVFPPGANECPYNYTNAEQVIAEMRRNAIGLAIAGHYHPGTELARGESAAFLAAPALCERPFAFLVITIDGRRVEPAASSPSRWSGQISTSLADSSAAIHRESHAVRPQNEDGDITVERHELRMNPELRLVDTHIHTQFAYCAENMEITKAMRLAEDFGLAGYGFAEHSGQLYFDHEYYWSGRCLADGIQAARSEHRRFDDYIDAAAQAGCPAANVGMEVDCDFEGRPLARKEDCTQVGFLIGAIHSLREFRKEKPDPQRLRDEFLALHRRFLRSGIRVLAHPFRIFRRAKMEAPPELFRPIAQMLRETGVAAEINFHTNEPPVEFVRRCIEEGVKLSLGTDSHNLYEVGELAPHLALIRQAGYDGDLADILTDPRRSL